MSANTDTSSEDSSTEQPNLAVQTDPNVDYKLLGNGIHEFIFLSNKPQGVTTWAHIVGGIMEHIALSDTMRQLLDVRKGVAPLSHLANTIRDLQRKYPNQQPSRLAVVSDNSFAPTLFNVLISLLPTANAKVRYFKPNERELAVRWLLAND